MISGSAFSYTIEVWSNGNFLSATVTKFCDYTVLCDKAQSLCLSTDRYLLLAHNKRITKVKMANQEVNEYATATLTNAGQASSDIQAVSPLSDGN